LICGAFVDGACFCAVPACFVFWSVFLVWHAPSSHRLFRSLVVRQFWTSSDPDICR
jgi:hypothetical protein